MPPTQDKQLHPGLENILFTETSLSYIDGEDGTLLIEGFPINELATNATYEESVYLLLNGQLPNSDERAAFQEDLASRREICDEVKMILRRAAEEGKPAMDALRMGAAAANLGIGEVDAEEDARRIIAVFPTLVATYWRYRQGDEPVAPRADFRHAANYLYMLTGEEPSEAAVHGLETYLNTVIDHGMNASTFTARVVVSTESDLVSAATAAIGSLKGPLHGGAPGPVLDMLNYVHEHGNIEEYIQKKLDSGERLMGFGHRVYRVRDPRAAVLSAAAERFYETKGDIGFFQTVQDFESVATKVLRKRKPERQLKTNVEFYTATLLQGVGVPRDLFTATFGVSRVGGWMAHCLEQLNNNRLVRPRARYIGPTKRRWRDVKTR